MECLTKSIQENIGEMVIHIHAKSPGHDPFSSKYSKMITLEKLGLNRLSHPKSFQNRDDMEKERDRLAHKLISLDTEKCTRVHDYHQGVKCLNEHEKLFSCSGNPNQLISDTMCTSDFVTDCTGTFVS
jgi:hypothetical protein